MKQNSKLKTPVLLIVYNRPDTTKKVIDALRKVLPENIYIFCDGPKLNNSESKERVEAVHQVCLRGIDWSCNLETNFQNRNLGCKNGVKQAIDWFFSNVEAGIILEDDIVPIESFFTFCEEMLEFYKDDNRIAQICGLSRGNDKYQNASYSFSRYPHIWGWATWSRAWQIYDDDMKGWEEIKKRNLLSELGNKKFSWYWTTYFNLVNDTDIDTWDYIWAYSVLTQNMLSVVPKNNLIANIGFNENATHTFNQDTVLPKTKPIDLPIEHPSNLMVDDSIPKNIQYQTMNTPQYRESILKRLKNKIMRNLNIS